MLKLALARHHCRVFALHDSTAKTRSTPDDGQSRCQTILTAFCGGRHVELELELAAARKQWCNHDNRNLALLPTGSDDVPALRLRVSV